MMKPKTRAAAFAFAVASSMLGIGTANGQAGPPFLTNDPGTPGRNNWEINVAAAPTISRGESNYQLPQIDLNFGVGERIQLTYEVPYVLQTTNSLPTQTGLGNGYLGVKWRFLDQGEGGWQMSTFPQVELGGSRRAREQDIAVAGPRYLLPVQVSKKLGDYDLDVEGGYYLPGNGPKERILGFVAGQQVNDRLEVDAELYDDHVFGGIHSTTLDVGGRYTLRPGIIALFMAGRSVSGRSDGQPEFMGYVGVQILLTDFGRKLSTEH